MPKRFTSTEKWDDPWYRKLKPEYKAFWDYLYCQCDNAGVWQMDWEDASFRVGYSMTTGSLKVINESKERVIMSKCGIFLLIKDFINFQIGDIFQAKLTNLQKNCITLLNKHLTSNRFSKNDFNITRSLPVDNGYATDIGKSKSKSKSNGKGNGNSKGVEKINQVEQFSFTPPKEDIDKLLGRS